MTPRTPPDQYRDGCTLAPDRFGAVSHADICDRHDLDYWRKRRFTDKWVADFLWALRIIKRHWSNWPWQPVACGFAVVGWAALTTAGWWFWMRRHRWD